MRILSILMALALLLSAALVPGALAEEDRAAVPSNPQRVVDLTGSGDVLRIMDINVVGTTNARSDDPTKLPSYLENTLAGAKVLGNSYQVSYDIEAIRSLNPDLILILPHHDALRKELQAIATTVTVSLNRLSWKSDMLSLGELFGRRTAVATWLDNYASMSHALGENIKKAQGEEFRCLPLMISAGQLYAFVDAGLGGVLFSDLGLGKPKGMSDRMGFNMTTISLEQLSMLEMDYLFLVGEDADRRELRGQEEWLKLPVVQKNHVKELPAEPYLGMAYSCVGADALCKEIAKMLHAKSEG